MVRSWLALVAPLAVLATALHTAFALQGKELHDTVGKMRDIKHEKYGKSHKKFNYFDQNEDEHITREEFREGLVRLGYKTTDQKLDHILEELDRDPKDERVNFVEFMRPTALKYKEEEELQRDADTDRAMEHMDTNFDGLVSEREFFLGLKHLAVLSDLDETSFHGFFVGFADASGDGFLSYEELDAIDPAILGAA